MKLIKLTINSDVTLEAGTLSANEVAQLLILVSRCRIVGSVYGQVGKTWVTEHYLKEATITMSRVEVEPHASYDAAQAHLAACNAAAEAATLAMSEPEKV